MRGFPRNGLSPPSDPARYHIVVFASYRSAAEYPYYAMPVVDDVWTAALEDVRVPASPGLGRRTARGEVINIADGSLMNEARVVRLGEAAYKRYTDLEGTLEQKIVRALERAKEEKLTYIWPARMNALRARESDMQKIIAIFAEENGAAGRPASPAPSP